MTETTAPEPIEATAWVATRLGAPTMALEIRTVSVPAPGPNQVRIASERCSLDFNDIDTIYGRYFLLPFEPPFVPGMVAAGVVEAAGPGAEFLLGRRVVGVSSGAQGGYASAAILDATSVQTVPASLSLTDAVAMYFPYLLGWLALRIRARVSAGDIVLVHAAAGGIGSGVVQLAKAFGAIVVATAGSDDKVTFAKELGADYAVNYRTDDFVAYVEEVTNGRGVDIAFDGVGGQVTTDTFRTMAFNGRHLIIGYASDIAQEERAISIQPAISGNFDLLGVCSAFVDDPRGGDLGRVDRAVGREHIGRSEPFSALLRRADHGDAPRRQEACRREQQGGGADDRRHVILLHPRSGSTGSAPPSQRWPPATRSRAGDPPRVSVTPDVARLRRDRPRPDHHGRLTRAFTGPERLPSDRLDTITNVLVRAVGGVGRVTPRALIAC